MNLLPSFADFGNIMDIQNIRKAIGNVVTDAICSRNLKHS